MKNILFVVHESKRTGAPLLLLHLLKEFEESNSFNIEILIKKTGELDGAFRAIGKTHLFYPKHLSRLDLLSKILRKLLRNKKSIKIYQNFLVKKLIKRNYDIVYFNSLGCQEIFPFLKSYPCKKVTHVHELKSVVEGMNSNYVGEIMQNSDFFISSYRTVSKFIASEYYIPDTKIVENSVYLFPQRKIAIDQMKRVSKKDGIFRVGGCGGVESRKGTDLFVDFAIRCIQGNPELKLEFIWIGDSSTRLAGELQSKVLGKGLQNKILFTGSTSTPENFFAVLDVFFLSSREEAFGLVGLENAYCGNPLIAFDIDGDLPLFIKENNCGKTISKFEFEGFNSSILELIHYPERSKQLGENGKIAVIRDFAIKDQARIISNALLI